MVEHSWPYFLLSTVDSKTTTTEEGEAQDALADEVLDRDGEEEAEVELSRDDVVNCICQMNEESGLMIQVWSTVGPSSEGFPANLKKNNVAPLIYK